MGAVTAKALCAAVMVSHSVFSPAGSIEACKDAKIVIEASEKYELDPYVLTALIQVESNWYVNAVSPSNACGLTQVLDRYSKYTCKELKNPRTSIFEGARVLNHWIKEYGKGDVDLGLCAYEKGFRCNKKKRRKKGLTYSEKVARLAADLKQKGENKCLSDYCF